MPTFLRSYVVVAGVMSVISLLLVELFERIVPVGLLGLSGIDLAFALVALASVFLLLASVMHRFPVLPAAIALVLTCGMACVLVSGMIGLTAAIMTGFVWLLGPAIQRRYQDRGLPMPSLWLITPSLLCPLSGVILLPFLLDTGRGALDAVAVSVAASFLGWVISTPSTWEGSATA